VKKWIERIFVCGIILFIASQAIRPARTNPPIDPTREITARLAVDPAVASIMDRSCNDCHSNRTVWPWYSNVAPISWFVINHVNEGRRHMNFSDWAAIPPAKVAPMLQRICKEVRSGGMPLDTYTPMHPGSKLTSADEDTICRWTDATSQNLPAAEKTP
jgi:hypothetical protein